MAPLYPAPLNAHEARVLAVYRFSARSLDLQLVLLPLFCLLRWVKGAALEVPDMRWVLLFLPVALGVDAVVYAWCGRTPGRWALRLEVVDAGGGRPSVARLLRRNRAVWFRGMGCGIAPFCAVVFWRLYARLRRGLPAGYDLRLGTEVRRSGPLSAGRERLFALVLAGVTLVSLYGVVSVLETDARLFWEDTGRERSVGGNHGG